MIQVKIQVKASSVIPAPVDRVWALLRDFNGLPAWLPGVTQSRIEEGGAPDRIGSVRRLELADGAVLREKLLALSDWERSVTYSILESQLPIRDYKSTIRVRPVTDGDLSFITWEGEFDAVGDAAAAMKRRMLHDIYYPGFEGLKRLFSVDGRRLGREHQT